MNKIFATAALCAVLSAPAMAQSSLIGDKDCFGLGGSCAEGTLWRDDLGGTFFTNYQGAGDPSFTDKWDADANITYFHDYTLGAASSAALTISTAGIADNRGPWAVFFNGTNIGEFTVNTNANAFQEVRLFTFAVPTALLTGHDQILLAINTTVNDGYSIDYSELNITAVPEPETLALMLAGLAVVGGVARRRAAR